MRQTDKASTLSLRSTDRMDRHDSRNKVEGVNCSIGTGSGGPSSCVLFEVFEVSDRPGIGEFPSNALGFSDLPVRALVLRLLL